MLKSPSPVLPGTDFILFYKYAHTAAIWSFRTL